MKTSELTKKLSRAGCCIVEHGSRHDRWHSPITGKDFMVWRHPSREIPKGTAAKIMADAGLS